MKQVYIELQNLYGKDLENAPDGFSVDEYLKEKSNSLNDTKKDELFCELVKKKNKS